MRIRARLPLWCAVPAGVLAAHAIGYVIAFRDAQYRAAVLAATGHGYLSHAAIVAVIAAAAGVSIAVARGLREQRSTRWWDAALRIAIVQTGAFFGVEVLERIAAGVYPFAGFTHVAAVGAAVQLLMGAIVAAVLLGFERAGRTIATAVRSERLVRPKRRGQAFEVRSRTVLGRIVAFTRSARAPPQLLAST